MLYMSNIYFTQYICLSFNIVEDRDLSLSWPKWMASKKIRKQTISRRPTQFTSKKWVIFLWLLIYGHHLLLEDICLWLYIFIYLFQNDYFETSWFQLLIKETLPDLEAPSMGPQEMSNLGCEADAWAQGFRLRYGRLVFEAPQLIRSWVRIPVWFQTSSRCDPDKSLNTNQASYPNDNKNQVANVYRTKNQLLETGSYGFKHNFLAQINYVGINNCILLLRWSNR